MPATAWSGAAARPNAFPSGGRYVEALQNTTMCFTDPRLRGARVDLDRLGMPRPISGNFASVFALTDAAGRRHAVKCFTQNVSDQQKRYNAISRRLTALKTDELSQPWKMEFEYLDAGILVDGFRWPVLKMAWMDGVGLLRWLEANYQRPQLVEQVAERFLKLVADLEAAGVAHGDLQHGNLLVAPDNTLRLVDYDGMYVDSLAGLPAAEDGHRHYQSPRRGAGDFGPTMDRFSAWLIYLSLLALAHDPGLWGRLHDPDGEFLLLEQSDLTLPQSSPRLSALETSSALGWAAAEQIRQLTSSPLASVPQLAPLSPLKLAQAQAAAQAAAGTGTGAWSGAWSTAGGAGGRSTNGNMPGRTFANGSLPAWMADHVVAEPVPMPQIEVSAFGRLRFLDRLCLGLALVTWSATAVLIHLADVTRIEGIAILCAAWFWMWVGRRYRPEVRGVRAHRRAHARVRKHNVDLEAQLARLDGDLAESLAERARQRAALTAERNQLSLRRMGELAAVDRECAAQLAAANGQISILDTKLNQQIRKELDVLRQSHARAEMAKFRIEVAVRGLPDLGPNAADKLIAAGIHSAADFTGVRLVPGGGQNSARNALFILRSGREVRVPSIGEHRARVLDEWRERMEYRALGDAPTALPPAREALLRTIQHERREFWRSTRTAVETETRRRREAVNLEIARTDADLANRLNGLTMADAQAARQHEQWRRPIEAELAGSRAVAAAYRTGLRAARRVSFPRYLWFLVSGH
jgi:hypothetical protein